MATTATDETPYTPADAIEYTKPRIPYCWSPEQVINVPNNPVNPDTPN